MRPKFIPREDFRAYLTGGNLNKWLRVDGLQVTSYIARCERQGTPIPFSLVGGLKRWRLLNIVAKARANCLSITPAEKLEVVQSIVELKQIRENLHTEVMEEKHVLSLQDSSSRLTKKGLLSKEEIVAGCLEIPNHCGVYFLLLKNEIVYVGQSVAVYRRINEHLASKRFERIAYIPCDQSELDVLESLYIHLFRPKLNQQKNKYLSAPLSLQQILNATT